MSALITYSLTRPLAAPDVRALLDQTTWGAGRNEAQTAHMIDVSVCIGAWDGDRLIGFARVLTDDCYRAFLEDVVVDNAYRGAGIGAEMVRRLLDRLAHVEYIMLTTGEDRRAFYQRLGFESSDSVHMYKSRAE